jgi:hypothetical protein
MQPSTVDLARSTTDIPRYSSIIGRSIDNTVLSAYMRCPSEAFKAYWLHRRNEGHIPTPSLGFGSGWHHVMEANYKAPESSESDLYDFVHMFAAERWEDHGIKDDFRTFDRLMLEYKKYLKQYGLPWREESKTLGWPTNPLVEIATEVAIPGARHPYTVKLDHPIRIGSQYAIEDHKTSSRQEAGYFKQYELDNQMMGYVCVGQRVTGHEMIGARIAALFIRKNDSEHERRTIPFGQLRLQEWERNYDRWLDRIERDLQMYQYLLDKGDDQQTAMDTAFPLNKWACHGRKYGHCSYVGTCALPPHLRQRALEEDFAVEVWNPLEADGEVDA